MSTLKTQTIQPPSDSDPLIVFTNATERLRIDTTGKFGIGTSTPGSALEIKNFVSSTTTQGITGTVANAGILLDVDFQSPVATRYSSGLFWRDTGVTTLPLAGIWVGDENNSGSSLHLGTSQTYANGINKIGLSIRNGFVGIGITEPITDLDISGANKQLWIRSGSGGALASSSGAGLKLEYVGSVNCAKIESYDYSTNTAKNLALNTLGGNVGINTSSPSTGLTVVGTIQAGGSPVGGTVILTGGNPDSGSYNWPQVLNVFGSEYSSGGSLVTWGLKPKTTGYGFESTHSLSAICRAALRVGTTQRESSSPNYSGIVVYSDTSATPTYQGSVGDNMDTRLSVILRCDGNVFQYKGNNVTTSSDYRLKDNIKELDSAESLSSILKIKPSEYIVKTGGNKNYGVIAHELQEVLPDIVEGSKDAVNEHGVPDYQTVQYNALFTVLISAVQELSKKVDQQAARIATLEAK